MYRIIDRLGKGIAVGIDRKTIEKSIEDQCLEGQSILVVSRNRRFDDAKEV